MSPNLTISYDFPSYGPVRIYTMNKIVCLSIPDYLTNEDHVSSSHHNRKINTSFRAFNYINLCSSSPASLVYLDPLPASKPNHSLSW